jgi:hypothetical protein
MEISDIELLLYSYTDSCGMVHYTPEPQRAPEGWHVNPEEERDGRRGRVFYHAELGTEVFVPMLPEGWVSIDTSIEE